MKYIGTSWKMNHTLSQGKKYAASLAKEVSAINFSKITPFIIPPFTSIESVRNLLPKSVLVGAQNMHWQDQGAYTGEISALMLKELGVELVEIGHSERRELFNETDQTVRLKTKQAVKHGLRPLICIGEPHEVKSSGHVFNYLKTQIEFALKELSTQEITQVIFAYEPIWAIGEKGTPAGPTYIGEMISAIKEKCAVLFPNSNIPVIYGGSVSLNLVKEFLQLDQCDGLFVGRAAWTARGFLEILREAS